MIFYDPKRRWELHHADVLEALRSIPTESVQCCVTSPPYWGLRNYQTPAQIWEGARPLCQNHEWELAEPRRIRRSTNEGSGLQKGSIGSLCDLPKTNVCKHCDSWLGSLGLEPTVELYVEHLVTIFREIWRILRSDGILFLNLGDSHYRENKSQLSQSRLKSKDLAGIPWRVAFALQAEGWWLRSDIIWAKKNCMPESVEDRPTRSHEYVFMLTKSARYFYDHYAIREPAKESSLKRISQSSFDEQEGGDKDYGPNSNRSARRTLKRFKAAHFGGHKASGYQSRKFSGKEDKGRYLEKGVNKRDVWWIATQPFKEAHFAVMPQKLVEPCVLAGTSEKGCCSKCGSPWKRVIEKVTNTPERNAAGKHNDEYQRGRVTPRGAAAGDFHDLGTVSSKMLGWKPSCSCGSEPIPQTILDPFSGSGTTGVVALLHDRAFIGIELNEKYIEMSKRRLSKMKVQRKLLFD